MLLERKVDPRFAALWSGLGTPVPGTWPNVGVGRINPDGSKGSCSSCHTRHRFSAYHRFPGRYAP